MRANARILALSVTALTVCVIPNGGAAAQEIGQITSIVISPQLDRTDVAGVRIEPEFTPEPIRAGPFVVVSSISIAGGYDTNVFDRTAEAGDAAVLVTPRLTLRADTSRHLLQVSAMGHVRRFASTGSENSEEFDVRAQTRLDLAERQALFANASFGHQIEQRSSVGTTSAADEPVNFDLATAQVGADVELGRLWLRPAANFEQSNYSDIAIAGTDTDLSFRNSRRYGGQMAVGFNFSELFAAFGELGYSQTESTDAAPGARRDAEDMTFLVGVRGEVSPLVTAEFAVGYRRREYELPQFLDLDGFSYRADVQWFITPLMTLRLEASQRFLNSGNVQVAGILSNRVSVTGYFDPLRNLRLSANVAYEQNDFREVDTVAKRPSMLFQAQYQANRHLSLGVFAGLRRQEVSGALLVQPFTSFSSGLGVTLTP